jgi:hypoxanthine phosphoribosyltransferase
VPRVGIRRLIGEAEIAARVEVLAAEIVRTLGDDFVVVGILKGALVFVADLVRALDRAGAAPEIELMRLASYGAGKESSGEVRFVGEIPDGFGNRRVLLVDDIVDSGRSIAHATGLLRGGGVGGLWTCALVDKPIRREVAFEVDFVGFSIGDVFIAGYGTDCAEKYRHLPYIGVVE